MSGAVLKGPLAPREAVGLTYSRVNLGRRAEGARGMSFSSELSRIRGWGLWMRW